MMISPQASNTSFKQIEDVIDARKRLGQYNVYKDTNSLNIKCVYSSFQNPTDVNRTVVKFDEASLVSQTAGSVRHTDSEITIVRIKCSGTGLRKNYKANKWKMMNDIAIPGDGTHLAESPSMVNLATLVSQNQQCEGDDEYLVPLSSWDPLIKSQVMQLSDLRSSSDSKLNEKYSLQSSSTEPNLAWRLENSTSATQTESEFEESARRQSWAGKISKFWRNQWRKSSALGDDTDKPERSTTDCQQCQTGQRQS